MLALMLIDLSFCDKALKFVPEDRLHSEAHKWFFTFIGKKFDSTGVIPTMVEVEDKIKFMDRAKRRLFTAFAQRIFDIKVRDPDYIKDELTAYSRKSLFVGVFEEAQVRWNSKNHDDAYSFVMDGINSLYGISFRDELAVDVGEFETVRQRYLYAREKALKKVPTNIAQMDEILGGGLEKGELGILLAEPKKGKSIGLIHMGSAALQMRMGHVAHFALEGTTEQTIFRYQSRLSGIPYNKIKSDDLTDEEQEKLDEVGEKFMSKLSLVPMNSHWSYTVLDIEAKLKELERAGKKPDMIVVDYGDLLKSHEKFSELRHQQTAVFRHLKQIAMIYGIAVWTASQAIRPKDDPEKEYLLRAKDISEAFEKVRVADFLATLNQTPKEKEMGILRLHVDIYRDNDADKTIRLITDFRRMIFSSKKFECIMKSPPWKKRKKK
jgi:hypothetical protein